MSASISLFPTLQYRAPLLQCLLRHLRDKFLLNILPIRQSEFAAHNLCKAINATRLFESISWTSQATFSRLQNYGSCELRVWYWQCDSRVLHAAQQSVDSFIYILAQRVVCSLCQVQAIIQILAAFSVIHLPEVQGTSLHVGSMALPYAAHLPVLMNWLSQCTTRCTTLYATAFSTSTMQCHAAGHIQTVG